MFDFIDVYSQLILLDGKGCPIVAMADPVSNYNVITSRPYSNFVNLF